MTNHVPHAVRQLIQSSPGRVASTRSIAQTGWDRHAVAAWVREGWLDRLAPAFVRLPEDDAPHQAAHLAIGYLKHHRPDDLAIFTGQYALSVLASTVDDGGRPAVLVEHGRRVRPRQDLFDVVQRSGLDRVPVLRLLGLPVAGPAYSLADHAATAVGDDDLIATCYLVINATRVRPVELVAAWSRMDHHGARRLLELTAQGVLEHESPAEHRLFTDVFAGHPPLPDCQVDLSPNIRVDFAYLFSGLVIEYLGEQSHANRVDEDGSRTYALRCLDFESIFVTKSVAKDVVGLRNHIHRTRREREELMFRGLLRRPAVPRQPERLTPLRTLVPGG